MIKSDLVRCVTDAALELCCGEAGLKDRLLSAVRALNVVLIRHEDWPPELRQRAQEISDELKVGGTPDATVAAIDQQSARRLAERILKLYADCQSSSVTPGGAET